MNNESIRKAFEASDQLKNLNVAYSQVDECYKYHDGRISVAANGRFKVWCDGFKKAHEQQQKKIAAIAKAMTNKFFNHCYQYGDSVEGCQAYADREVSAIFREALEQGDGNE